MNLTTLPNQQRHPRQPTTGFFLIRTCGHRRVKPLLKSYPGGLKYYSDHKWVKLKSFYKSKQSFDNFET